MPATAAPIAGFAAVRRSGAAPRRGGFRPDAARRPAAPRPLARVPPCPFDRLREVMRLAGLRVATDFRDFVAGLPRRAPLAPAFADPLADAAFAALEFFALFLLGLVGFRAMAGLLAGPYTGRAEGAIATRAGARRGRGRPRERRRRRRSRRGRTKSRRGAGRRAGCRRSRARRWSRRSRSGSRGRRSRGSRGYRSRGSRGCRSRGFRSYRSSRLRRRRLSRRGFAGGGALGSRTLGLLG